MVRIILEKGKKFDKTSEYIRGELEKRFFGKEFSSLQELLIDLFNKKDDRGCYRMPGTVYIPKKEIKIDDLPYQIKEWPLYGPTHHEDFTEEIAIIKMVE